MMAESSSFSSSHSRMGTWDDNPKAVEITGKVMVIAVIVLFMVVVFVIFLHLYAKWFWWNIQQSSSSPTQRQRGRRSLDFPQDHQPSGLRITTGLDKAILHSIPVLTFHVHDDPQQLNNSLECAVCLSQVLEGEKVRLLPKCNHGYHVDCIDMWFHSHSTCPLCRNTVVASQQSSHAISISISMDHQSLDIDLHDSDSDSDSDSSTTVESPTLTQLTGAAAASSSSSSAAADSGRPQEGLLMIDIPVSENFSSTHVHEQSSKSPMVTRLRSFKRLLSSTSRDIKQLSSPTSTSCSPDDV